MNECPVPVPESQSGFHRAESLALEEMILSFQFSFFGTFPETNISPENQWLEDEISFWDGLFSGAMLVLGSVSAKKTAHLNFSETSGRPKTEKS